MIYRVNSWDLVDQYWPIDSRPVTRPSTPQQDNYIFNYRDEPYKHILGGRWSLFSEYRPSTRIDTWV